MQIQGEFYRFTHMGTKYKPLDKLDVEKSKVIPLNWEALQKDWKEVKNMNFILVPKEVYEFFDLK